MKKDDRKQLRKNANKYDHFQPLIVKADLHLVFQKSLPTSVSRVSRSGSATDFNSEKLYRAIWAIEC